MRPREMLHTKRSAATFSGLLLAGLVAGCGTAATTSDDPAAGGSSTAWHGCTATDVSQAGRPLGTLESGSGGSAEVRLVAPGEGPCAGSLVARTDAGVAGVDVSDLDLDASSAHVVHLRGADGDGPQELLLVEGGAHPRGGFQPHLFTTYGGLHEVTVDGNPLLPFVATDGGGLPATARCGDGGTVEVLTATTSEPPGVVLAWDVQRTTYRIGDAGVEQIDSEQIEDHAADPVLRKDMPQLFEPDGFFADCRG
ncbi:MAG: hypothetical protein ACTHKG_12780 [Nocardioides sp.]